MTERVSYEAVRLPDNRAEVGVNYADGEYYTLAVLDREERDGNYEDAQKIARAMNSHDALVAALRAIVENADGTGCEDCAVVNAEYIAQAEAALAMARQ